MNSNETKIRSKDEGEQTTKGAVAGGVVGGIAGGATAGALAGGVTGPVGASIGAALAYSAIPLLIMDAVPSTETAAANSLNSLMRMLGTSSCSACTTRRPAVRSAVASSLPTSRSAWSTGSAK